MSTIKTVLSRMTNDSVFANEVFANVEQALAEYNLSGEEIAKLKEISQAKFKAMSVNPAEDRKSFPFGRQTIRANNWQCE